MGSYIELNAFLKLKGFASTGGQAKQLIRSEAVLVNGDVETRNKKKLIVGDDVQVEDSTITVQSEDIIVKEENNE